MNWAKVFRLGASIVSMLIAHINTIEAVAAAVPALKGSSKEDAVVSLTKDVLSSEQITKDLWNDPKVEEAVRSYIQAYVALQNVVSTQSAAQPQ